MSAQEIQIKELVAHKWDLASETFDTHPGHGIQSKKEKDAWKDVFREIFPEKDLKILDVGCGTGELSLLFAEMGHKVTGIDISKNMLEIAKSKARTSKANVSFEIGDAENPTYNSSSFDIVFNRHLLWTLPNPEKAIKNWSRVLKNGGKVIIIDGVWDDGSIEIRIRRCVSYCATLLIQRKNPGKGHCRYSKNLKTSLPLYGGAPLKKVEDFLSGSNFQEIRSYNLKKVREAQKENMPFSEKILRTYQYYLICGRK